MENTNLPNISSDKTSQDLSDKLGQLDAKGKEKDIEAKAESLVMPYIDLHGFPVSIGAIALIPEETAKQDHVVCFFYSGKEVRVGTSEPMSPQVKLISDELKEKKHVNVKIYLISDDSLNFALELYAKVPKYKEVVGTVEITQSDVDNFQVEVGDFDDLQEKVNTVNISELVTLLIASALKTKSSDIHVEAEEKDVKVRFRIDGILNTVAIIKLENWPKIISRIKLLAGLKINVDKKPQDGRFTIDLTEDKVDVRVSTVPTSYGESVVMRLLRSSAAGLEFSDIGLRGKSFVDLKHEIQRPNGMIISTGPTGSGKTTTLYAILNKLNKPETKIISLEDPIEYRLEGINQSQIDHSKDYTFAKGLKSIVRQDPDVIMVGEIRDLETADVSLNAALTGHLVISTIHTNSASGAIPRFLAMGVKPFLLSPALNAVIGQRLVRKICESCKVEDPIDNDAMTKILNILNKIPIKSAERLEEEVLSNLKFYKGKGCSKCHNLG
ncbi:type II/IV secretion system protein, partial [bacterium]|nr:type II/IV secretion system protein [bacterium]